MILLYNIIIWFYFLLIRVAALFHPKAAAWVAGRKGQIPLGKLSEDSGFTVWMHCASLGEFEQGRPVIERIKASHPDATILLSFFSPSGYEIRKDYPLADRVVYLPLDTAKNAERFIEHYNPQLAIFVKYEFWYHFLKTLHSNNIPTLLISARFRQDQLFFKWYGRFYKDMLLYFEHIFVQDEGSRILLGQEGIGQVSVAGDTRVENVIKKRKERKAFPIVSAFCKNKKILICGSTWLEDEKIIAQLVSKNKPDWKYIIAPHEIGERKLRALEAILPESLRYSLANVNNAANAKIMIIDNIGMLSYLYRFGNIAYIGGGFGKGIHNCLEAAVYEIPVIFGPRFQRFEEALILVKNNAAFSIKNELELESIFVKLQDDVVYTSAKDSARQYFLEHKGATDRIMAFIERFVFG